jgi:hypothetical protein
MRSWLSGTGGSALYLNFGGDEVGIGRSTLQSNLHASDVMGRTLLLNIDTLVAILVGGIILIEQCYIINARNSETPFSIINFIRIF